MKGKELLLIALSSFFLTVIWIASNVYHSYATSTIDSLLQVQILPIAPSFDAATIENLKQRQPIKPSDSSVTLVTPSPSVSPTPSVTIDEELPLPTLPEEEIVDTSPTPTIAP